MPKKEADIKKIKTKYEKIAASIKRMYPYIDVSGQKRMVKQTFARFIAKGNTIGNWHGRVIVDKISEIGYLTWSKLHKIAK